MVLEDSWVEEVDCSDFYTLRLRLFTSPLRLSFSLIMKLS
jgi:hypothetical protein